MSNQKNTKKRIIRLALISFFISSIFLILNVESINAQSGCSDQITGVNRYNSCRVQSGDSLFVPTEGCSIPFIQINNSSDKDLFIPTKNCAEFNSVVVHLPTNTNASTSSGLSCGENFIDSRDSQSYPTKLFGSQCWMTKNLNYALNNGTGSWCYANNLANCTTYGRLYNWPTANSACPPGWRLPSVDDFTTLQNTIGSARTAWMNSSEWAALYGGNNYYQGSFGALGTHGYWRVYDSYDETDSPYLYISSSNSNIGWGSNFNKNDGLSVRCLKDSPSIKNGDFESGNASWWNTQGDVSVNGTYKYSGNYGSRVYSTSTKDENNTSKLTQALDLTNKDFLKFNYKYSGSTSCLGQGGNMYIRVKINGVATTLFSQGGQCTNPSIGWTEKVIDVSSLSGDKLIEFEVQTIGGSMDGSGSSMAFIVDDVELLNRMSPIISLSGATKTYGDSAFTITHSTNSTGTKSFSSSNTSVATINSSGVVTITGAGTTTITFNVGSSVNYSASSATATLTVNWGCGANFVDIRNGQSYPTKLFGSQCWMTKNLDYALNNGTGSWCYANNLANCNTYGRLYNWSTATSACPSGWHFPSDAEFTTLQNTIGSTRTAWMSTSGWHGLYGGARSANGHFYDLGTYGYWWSS
ncbi:MAG: FISUMP domain-containing protein, partial [Paludibacteraceae bacterium]